MNQPDLLLQPKLDHVTGVRLLFGVVDTYSSQRQPSIPLPQVTNHQTKILSKLIRILFSLLVDYLPGKLVLS